MEVMKMVAVFCEVDATFSTFYSDYANFAMSILGQWLNLSVITDLLGIGTVGAIPHVWLFD